MKIEPLKDKIILKQFKLEEKNNNILIANSQNSTNNFVAKIVAVYPEITALKANDIVLLNKYGAQEFYLQNEQYFVADVNDCIAKIRPQGGKDE